MDFPESGNETFYDIIPIFSTAANDNAVIPSEALTPTISRILYKDNEGKETYQQERKLILEKTSEDVYIRLNIYGYRKKTEFDYQTRCRPNI